MSNTNMSNIKQLRTLGTLCLLFVCAPVGAQERPLNFYQTSPLNFSAGYDSGVAVGSQRFSGSSLLLSAPTLSLMRTAPRTDFSLSYQPEFEMFPSFHSLN